jgi:hypothetical protein
MRPSLCQRDSNRAGSCVIDAGEQGLPRYLGYLNKKTPKQQEKEPWYEESAEQRYTGRMSKRRADHALRFSSTATMGGVAMCQSFKEYNEVWEDVEATEGESPSKRTG